MPTTLVLLAHPEPASFNGAWARSSVDAARALGHDVLFSDLYASGFDPAECAGHYAKPPTPFDPLKAQENNAPPPDVAGQIAQLARADRLILHFPMWWFAPPAMVKGWCDRVLAHGHLHDTAHRFDTGRLSRLEVLFCITTGGDAVESGPDGREGDWRLLLWPLAQTLRYVGATVKQPVAVHGVHGYHTGARRIALESRLAKTLADHFGLLANWAHRPAMPFNPDHDFDDEGRLRIDAPSHTPFIRHPG
ncbi:MAG: NAD(P)H-dependent oxidoreductase [Rhodobacterales bacterium]|nr:NAD(P)H-dependent oxidoreductase [Rhodobacterales bacterium]